MAWATCAVLPKHRIIDHHGLHGRSSSGSLVLPQTDGCKSCNVGTYKSSVAGRNGSAVTCRVSHSLPCCFVEKRMPYQLRCGMSEAKPPPYPARYARSLLADVPIAAGVGQGRCGPGSSSSPAGPGAGRRRRPSWPPSRRWCPGRGSTRKALGLRWRRWIRPIRSRARSRPTPRRPRGRRPPERSAPGERGAAMASTVGEM
jgi:hypothetical protein